MNLDENYRNIARVEVNDRITYIGTNEYNKAVLAVFHRNNDIVYSGFIDGIKLSEEQAEVLYYGMRKTYNTHKATKKSCCTIQ